MLLRRFHADWVLPIVSPPIARGCVTVLDDRVVAVGPPEQALVVDAAHAAGIRDGAADAETDADAVEVQEIDLGRVAIMPGLVNAHTHIELSWMWGKVKPRGSFVEWVTELMMLRATATPTGTQAMTEAIAGMEECGTAAVGDISNTLASIEPIAHSKLQAVVFRELIGFGAPEPDLIAAQARAELDRRPPFPRIRLALAPHAPYSVSPRLFRAIARDAAAHRAVTTVHLGETPEELRFLQEGSGPFRELLERVGAWNPAWQPPKTGPVDYVASLGMLTPEMGPRTMVVHGVQFRDAELATLARVGATLVTCPRSNVWVGVGDPPVERFYASGVRVAIGTDSLASASDLNVFSELAALHHLAPGIPAARLLSSATRVGAEALGFPDLGQITPGASARLIAVDLPETVRDIETYLVEGIDPGQIYWLPI